MAKSTIKFKDTVVASEVLQKNIAARQYAPVYLLMGEEGYFIDMLAEQLATTVLGEAERSFSQIVVYGRDSDAGAVTNLCRQMPMMGVMQVIIVREAQHLKQLEKLSVYTSKPQATTLLVLCHKDKNVDKRSALYKSVLSGGVVLESVRPRDYEIGTWLTQFITARGLSIDTKATAMLVEHLGTDIARITGELDKLMLRLPEGVKKITEVEIEENIGISREYNNYELMKAVGVRNVGRAMYIADHFAKNPKEHPLLVTILSLFGLFRELFQINYLRWLSQRKGVPFPSDSELMGILRVNNIYALNDLKQNAAKWDNKKVFSILGLLREYDGKSKGMNAGGATDGELLKELLLKIFA